MGISSRIIAGVEIKNLTPAEMAGRTIVAALDINDRLLLVFSETEVALFEANWHGEEIDQVSFSSDHIIPDKMVGLLHPDVIKWKADAIIERKAKNEEADRRARLQEYQRLKREFEPDVGS